MLYLHVLGLRYDGPLADENYKVQREHALPLMVQGFWEAPFIFLIRES